MQISWGKQHKWIAETEKEKQFAKCSEVKEHNQFFNASTNALEANRKRESESEQ